MDEEHVHGEGVDFVVGQRAGAGLDFTLAPTSYP